MRGLPWPVGLHGRLVGAVLAVASTLSHASPANITDGELALLPAYCQDVQAIRWGNASYNPSPRAAHWVSLMGEPFWALHHYCWGLIHVRRSQAAGLAPVMRTGMLTSAVNDYFYVIKNAPRSFVLAPEIYLRIAEARMMLGDSSGADDAYRISRELKPDYWPAYTQWIDALLKFNRKAEALALAAEGLQFAPGSKELADRYRKLGGDPSKVAPKVPAVAAPTPTTPPSTEAASATAARPDPAASSPTTASQPTSATAPL
jgi:tetratricopeptide (TPR) repeat protein